MFRLIICFCLSEADCACLPVAAVSVPKKKRKIKDLNKKEAVGDLLDAFKEVCVLGGNAFLCLS